VAGAFACRGTSHRTVDLAGAADLVIRTGTSYKHANPSQLDECSCLFAGG